MEETVKQRLISFIKYKGLNVKRFETLIGVSNGFVNNISRSIGAEKLYNISNEFPDLNTAWLLTGEGEMLRQDNAVTIQDGTDGIPFYDRAIEHGTLADALVFFVPQRHRHFYAALDENSEVGGFLFLPLHNICTTFFSWGLFRTGDRGLFCTGVCPLFVGSFSGGVFFSSSLPCHRRRYSCPPGQGMRNTISPSR